MYCAVTDQNMARAIAGRCHQILEPLYRSKGAKKFAKKCQNDVIVTDGIPVPTELQVHEFSQIHSRFMPILSTLGPMLSVDPLLFSKIVRLARVFFKEYKYADLSTKEYFYLHIYKYTCIYT